MALDWSCHNTKDTPFKFIILDGLRYKATAYRRFIYEWLPLGMIFKDQICSCPFLNKNWQGQVFWLSYEMAKNNFCPVQLS